MTNHSATLHLVDIGTVRERLVVTEADDVVWVAPELVSEWRAGEARHVTMDGERVTFGTIGEGLGRPTYELTGERGPYDYFVMRRIEAKAS